MAKSTQAQALKSLSHKFQKKIIEVGQLKKQLAEAANIDPVVQSLRLDVAFHREAATCLDKEADRLYTQVHNAEARNRDLRADVASWKSFSVIACVLGAAVGVFSTFAYFTL